MNILTLNEELLLSAIYSLGDNAYGVSIMQKIQNISEKRIVFGTLYNSLRYLEQKGYVATILGEPTAERGGKSKVYYSLTKKGMSALKETQRFLRALWNWIPDLESGFNHHE